MENGTSPRHLTGAPIDVLQQVFEWLPLADLSRLRSVSTAMADTVSKKLLTRSAGHLVLPLPAFKDRIVHLQPRTALRWICGQCRTHNNISKAHCPRCDFAAPEDRPNVRRLFLGQLRKELTVEYVDWLFALVAPDIIIFHIENHTSKDGRGRGSAWIYVFGCEAEATVTNLSGRVFLDIDDETGKEQLHVCASDAMSELNQVALHRSCQANRPLVLPRRALAVERPVTGLEATRSRGALTETTIERTNASAKPKINVAGAVVSKVCKSSPDEHAIGNKGGSRAQLTHMEKGGTRVYIALSSTQRASQMTMLYRHNPYGFAPLDS